MTAIGEILENAFFEVGMTTELQHATPTQTQKAMGSLQRLINSMLGNDAGELPNDWPLGNYGRQSPEQICLTTQQLTNPPLNRRLIATNEAATTLYLSPGPQDGAVMQIVDPFGRLATVPVTLDGNGRTIEGASSLVLNSNGTNRTWFYRADLGDWKRIIPLVVTDDMPFPEDFDQYFTVLLGMRLNPSYGKALARENAIVIDQGRRDFIARYVLSLPLAIDDSISWPFLSRQGYDAQRAFSSPDNFSRGYPWGR